MEKRKFIREPGVVYDLQFLYTLFFNQSYSFTNFAVEDTDDKDFFMSLILENKDISKSFLPFFKRVNDRGIFFSKYYFDKYEKEIFNGFGVSDICRLVLDVDSFASNLLGHYFPGESRETLEKCRKSLPDLCRLVHASDYDDTLKSELINFLSIRTKSYSGFPEIFPKDMSGSKTSTAAFMRASSRFRTPLTLSA